MAIDNPLCITYSGRFLSIIIVHSGKPLRMGINLLLWTIFGAFSLVSAIAQDVKKRNTLRISPSICRQFTFEFPVAQGFFLRWTNGYLCVKNFVHPQLWDSPKEIVEDMNLVTQVSVLQYVSGSIQSRSKCFTSRSLRQP